MKSIGHYLQQKTKHVTGLIKNEVAGKIMAEYIVDEGKNDKKSKRNKEVSNKKSMI